MLAPDAHHGGARARPSLLAGLHPSVLLTVFAVVLVTCVALDPFVPAQTSVVVVAAASWIGLCGLPLRRLARIGLFGASLFLPFFLLAPWIDGGDEVLSIGDVVVTTSGLLIPGRIAIRGVLSVLLGAGLAWATDPTSLAVGLSRIPVVPRIMVVMTVQTLRWAEVLIEESRGIARAIALRGGGGGRGGLELVRSLPLVWLPRVIARADRVTAAMEVRGYGGELPERELPSLGRADLLGLAGAALLGGLALALGVMS